MSLFRRIELADGHVKYDPVEPACVRYALEKAGIAVSETELETICRKLGIDQQQPQPEKSDGR